MKAIFAGLAVLFVVSCSLNPSGGSEPLTLPVPKGSRVLGMDTNNARSGTSFDADYSDAMLVGVRSGTVHITWSVDETGGTGTTASGTFSNAFLGIANSYYPGKGSSRFTLTVSPVDTTGYTLPSDLRLKAINDSVVVTRFKSYVDYILSQVTPANLVNIQVGNEVDVPSSGSPYWTNYTDFLTQVVTYIHGKGLGIPVGTTVTLGGAINSANPTVQNGILGLFDAGIDELGITYYPMDLSFQFKDPGVVLSDIDALMGLVNSKKSGAKVYIQEAGYATGTGCGGSEAKQALFVQNLFTAWDKYQTQIPFVSILRLNDLSHSSAVSMAGNYGLGSNPAFIAYLETLGLRPYATGNKAAWGQVQSETQKRGW